MSTRLGKLAFQIATASKGADEEAVHDLRVAIRRFDETLSIFRALVPRKAARKIRRRLRDIRKSAGEVRDRDIALGFLAKSGVGEEDALWTAIAGERKVAESSLGKQLKRWNGANLSRKWRADLQLGS
ncbi:MAG: CHAD domain-containing protein [Bryobacteraceae bacterium]|nr:CHAD domain-containing protein [Bryobacteraceae bacterium]